MYAPEPAAGHRLLARMEGVWEGEETMHPSEWDPAGGTAFGRNVHRVALGGFALVIDYEQIREGVVTFSGHGVYTYDPARDLVTLHWFDSLGSPPEVFTGRFENDVLTLGHGGPGMHARMTYDLTETGTMKGGMEMSKDGVNWRRLFDATYRRVS